MTASLLHALRRLRVGLAIAVLVAIAVPVGLGPAGGRILRVLGAQAHLCKCGMKPGTCGCPECARLEQARLDDRTPCPIPAMRRHCDDKAPVVGLLGAALALPIPFSNLPLAGFEKQPCRRAVDVARLEPAIGPPTPPPRIAL